MSQQSLRERLEQVHERLGASGALDAESRKLLGTLMHDIERALAPGAATAAPAAAGAVAAHASHLESLAVDFQAGHPALATLLRELIDALGKAGI